MFNRIVLTLVFTLSFLTYLAPEITLLVQLTPLVLFAALVFFKVVCSNSFLRAVGSLAELDAIYFVFFLSLFILAPSIGSNYDKSPWFAVFVILCLIVARLYLVVVPIREVLEAYFWSGIVSVIIFIAVGFAGLLQSIETLERFTPFSFHPNLLGFLLAGYFCVMVWKFITGGWRMKVLSGLVGLACLVIIFLAASRGSLVGIFAGLFFVAAMEIVRAKKEQRRRILRFSLLTAAPVLGLFLYVYNLERTQAALSYVDVVLQLSDDYRGYSSGLSGRLDRWKEAASVFTDGTFLIGRGIRYTDLSEATIIDNSYLVILYEVGLVPLILIMWRFLSIARRFVWNYFHSRTESQRHFYLACSLLMVTLLVTNIVDRYLFGVGNPYSLVAFMMFAAPTSEVEHFLATPDFDTRPARRLAT
jgi:hypothetical protein